MSEIKELTPRDYFAAKAMQSLILVGAQKVKTYNEDGENEYDYPDQPFYFGNWGECDGVNHLAMDAYTVADAMIAQREKKP